MAERIPNNRDWRNLKLLWPKSSELSLANKLLPVPPEIIYARRRFMPRPGVQDGKR